MFWPAPVNLFFSPFHGKAHSDLIDWINAWCQIKKSVWQESQYELVHRGMILFSTTCISEKHRRSVLGYISLFRNKARFMQYLMNVFPQNAKKMSMLTKIRIQGIHYVVQNEKKNQDCTCSKNMPHVIIIIISEREQPICIHICFWFYYIILDFIILFKRKIKSIVLLPFISSRKVLEYTYSLLFQCHDMQ